MITCSSLFINFYFLDLEQWSDYLRTNWAIRKSNGATTWERMEQYEWAKRMSFANEWTRERHLRMSFCEMSEQESDISEWVLRMSEQESDICEMKQKIKVGKKWATWNHYLTTGFFFMYILTLSHPIYSIESLKTQEAH